MTTQEQEIFHEMQAALQDVVNWYGAPIKNSESDMYVRNALTAILGFIAALAASQASADDLADFYKRQRISLIVGNGTGGGYDVYARVLARYISNYIPGNPGIIVQNMPGAGGLRAANYIYNVAAKNGTVFGTFARNMPLMGLIKSNHAPLCSAQRIPPRGGGRIGCCTAESRPLLRQVYGRDGS